MRPRCLKCGKDHATRNIIKSDKKTRFVYQLPGDPRSLSISIQNAPNPQPKKELQPFPTRYQKKLFSKWTREFPSLTLLVEKSSVRQTPRN
ncbi:hypothetical protein TNCV_1623141 [Trichonephila clavipes]|nr:hypothetical protein TNCV_1623141 [Trichonephila clavipes]